MIILTLHENSKGIPQQFLREGQYLPKWDHEKISYDEFIFRCVLSQGIILV